MLDEMFLMAMVMPTAHQKSIIGLVGIRSKVKMDGTFSIKCLLLCSNISAADHPCMACHTCIPEGMLAL